MASLAPEFSLDFRKLLRTAELEAVIPLLPPGARILEIGAGAGWQAKELSKRGFSVTAIDINSSVYRDVQEWNVIEYDGYRIPLEDGSVDVVFSSNVLEHVPHIEEFIPEMQRVLVPGGYMVHVMPTTLWRAVTTLAFYPYRVKVFALRTLGKFGASKEIKPGAAAGVEGAPSSTGAPKRSLLARLLLPTLHGVRGNVVSEHFFFSSHFWSRTFTSAGVKLARMQPAGILYSGYKVLGPLLPIATRRVLARAVGSSCRFYITEQK